MSDSLRQRVSRVIAGGAHALLNRIEEAAPIAILEQSVREVEAIAEEVRSAWGKTIANKHLAQQQHVALNKEHERLDEAISQAIGQNREDLARAAIARQIDIESQLPILEASMADMATEERELSGFVDALQGKKREMETAIRELEKSRESLANLSHSGGMQAAATAAKLEAAQSAFDRVYQRQTGLSAIGRQATLEQSAKLNELGELVRENKINARLAAIKAQ